MKNTATERIVLKYISAHEGQTVSDMYNGLNHKEDVIPLSTLRRLVRRLHREKKVTRTGVHAFKYKLKK